jgi:hypothetical protein
MYVVEEFCFAPCREGQWRRNQSDLAFQSVHKKYATNNALTLVVKKEASEINQVHYCDVLTD